MKKLCDDTAAHLMLYKKRLWAECERLKRMPGNSAAVGDYESAIDSINAILEKLPAFAALSGVTTDIFNIMRSRPDVNHIVVNVSAKGYNPELPEDFEPVCTHQFCNGDAQPLENPLGEATRVVDGKWVN